MMSLNERMSLQEYWIIYDEIVANADTLEDRIKYLNKIDKAGRFEYENDYVNLKMEIEEAVDNSMKEDQTKIFKSIKESKFDKEIELDEDDLKEVETEDISNNN